MVRGYTTIEQSCKLAEILPLESADMLHCLSFDGDLLATVPKQYSGSFRHQPELTISCWSLAALLGILPFPVLYMEMLGGMILWSCECHFMETDEVVKMEHYDNPVDAYVDMVEKLNELNLL